MRQGADGYSDDSIWGFLLLGVEAIRHHKTSPYVIISGQPTIPTWSAPIVMVLLAAVLLPGSSALGHLCGLAIGYICRHPFPTLTATNEQLTSGHSRSGIHQVPCAAGVGIAVDRGQVQAPVVAAILRER